MGPAGSFDRRIGPVRQGHPESHALPASPALRTAPLRLLTVILLLLGFPALLYAHLALTGSTPTADESLTTVPSEIRLDFTEAVELPLSSIMVTGPGGEVDLLPLEASENGRTLRAGVAGPIVPGEYIVRWQAVGGDGHPVRGEFVFHVEEGAAGAFVPAADSLTGAGVSPDASPAAESPLPLEPTAAFNTSSPLYAAVRALGYVSLVGTTGVAAFILLVLAVGGSAGPTALPVETRLAMVRSATQLGLLTTGLLALSLALRIQAQSYAVFGEGVSGESFRALTSTGWGIAWIVQVVGAVLALAGFLLAMRQMQPGLALAVVGAVLAAISPGLSGHAATVETLRPLPVLADGLHVLAAGVWLGTLFVIVAVGLPHLRRLPDLQRRTAVSTLLRAFSALALTAAGILFATGLLAAFLHLEAVSDLLTTTYGRLLLAKLALVLGVGAFGAYNWRRLPLRERTGDADRVLRRTGAFELTVALLVIGVTSVLVAITPPAAAPDPASAALTSTTPD